MRRLIATFVFGLGVATSACAASGDDGATSQQDLTGSLANARACAVRDVYEAAELDVFPVLAAADIPASIPTSSAIALSKLSVPNVGIVYVVEDAQGTSFYAASGALLARSAKTSNGAALTWSTAGGALSCDSIVSPPSPPPPPPSGPVSCATTTACTTGANAFDLGELAGDVGADVKSVTGYGDHWIKVFVTESSFMQTDLRMKATLTSPPGANFDLFVHTDTCSTPSSQSEKPAGEADVATVDLPDTTLGSDSAYVLLEVRHVGAETCNTNAKWTLKIEGNK